MISIYQYHVVDLLLNSDIMLVGIKNIFIFHHLCIFSIKTELQIQQCYWLHVFYLI